MVKVVKDWTKLILSRTNTNSSPSTHFDTTELYTTDPISIKSKKEVEAQPSILRTKAITDFALMNNGLMSAGITTPTGKNSGSYFLRSFENLTVDTISNNGDFVGTDTTTSNCGISPCFTLALPNNVSINNISQEIGEIKEVKTADGTILYHTIDLGEYPRTRVDSDLQKQLEFMYNEGHLRHGMKCTGRMFSGAPIKFRVAPKQNPEFEYMGKKYIRTRVINENQKQYYQDGTEVPKTGTVEWVKVEPIPFRIENYNDLLNGTAKTLELDSDEIIIAGTRFNDTHSPSPTTMNLTAMWQNSKIRAFLNSAVLFEMDRNIGCIDQTTYCNYNFSNDGFLKQALDLTSKPSLEYTVSKNFTTLDKNTFEGCIALKKIVLHDYSHTIQSDAFNGCTNLQIDVSNNLNFRALGYKRFREDSLHGTNFKYVYIPENYNSTLQPTYLTLSQQIDKNLEKTHKRFDFTLDMDQPASSCKLNPYLIEELTNAGTEYVGSAGITNLLNLMESKKEKKVNYIPPGFALNLFPPKQMQNFYINGNAKRWGKLVNAVGFDTLSGSTHEKRYSLDGLMKIYYALGGFSNKKGESEKAYDYVLKYVATSDNPNTTPSDIGAELHRRFYRFNTMLDKYNPEFAKFFMKYYHENHDFMVFKGLSGNENDDIEYDYLANAHNRFDKILEAYPNRVVNGNDQRALLTPMFVAKHSLDPIKYSNVEPGNEALAELANKYGYSQFQFDTMQNIFDNAKTLKDSYVICANKSSNDNGISFKLLEKDDPVGFILGDLTNCCQRLGDAGESCVWDGYNSPNAGFLIFEESTSNENESFKGKRVLGQAYIWYDPITKTVCYDNIEIPTAVLNKLRKGTNNNNSVSSTALIDSVIESADAIMYAMNKRGIKVDRVTTGEGYNDLRHELRDRFGEPEKNPQAKHRLYNGYTDADYAQFVIRTYEETTKKYANAIQETAQNIHNDLNEIKAVTSNKVRLWGEKWKILIR